MDIMKAQGPINKLTNKQTKSQVYTTTTKKT